MRIALGVLSHYRQLRSPAYHVEEKIFKDNMGVKKGLKRSLLFVKGRS